MRADAEALYNANHRGLFRYLCRAVGHVETARDLTRTSSCGSVRRHPATSEGHFAAGSSGSRNLAGSPPGGQRRRPGAAHGHGRAAGVAETSVEVNDALASLADVDRDVFLMRVAGLRYDEIASACGLAPDAVRSADSPRACSCRTTLGANRGAPDHTRSIRPEWIADSHE